MCEVSKPDIRSLLELLESFSQAVLRDAMPELDGARCERAYKAALQVMCNHPCLTYFLNEGNAPAPGCTTRRLQLNLTHQCKYIGCHKSTCDLCRNNQEKQCAVGDNMDEYYIVRKSIKAKCGADVQVQLIDADTKKPVTDLNLHLQISLTDGDRIEHPEQLDDLADIEILANKDGSNQPLLLTANPVRRDACGRLLITLQNGVVNLPDISVSSVTEKLEVKSFRLLVCTTTPSSSHESTQPVIEPALSCKFKVITQRAWNDRKASYPHVDDRVNRLDFIGKEAVGKLCKLEQELAKAGFSLPSLKSIQKVGQLKQLKEHMQQDHGLQSTVIRMLNLNHERWNNICHVLDERTVVSDNLPRAFFPPPQHGIRDKKLEGLFYKSRQAKVDLKNPDGLIEKMPTEDGRDTCYMVTLFSSGSTAVLHKKVDHWRTLAISCWGQEGHPGWCIAPEHRMEGNTSPRSSSWGGTSTNTAAGIRSALEVNNMPSPRSVKTCLDSPSCHGSLSRQYVPGLSPRVPRDISNVSHIARPKRAHSECISPTPLTPLVGGRCHSAPGGPPADTPPITTTTDSSPRSTQTREASHSAAGSSNTVNSTSPPNSSRYTDAPNPDPNLNPDLPYTPRGVARSLFSSSKGRRTSNRSVDPHVPANLDSNVPAELDVQILEYGLHPNLNPNLLPSLDAHPNYPAHGLNVDLGRSNRSPFSSSRNPGLSLSAAADHPAALGDMNSSLTAGMLPSFSPTLTCPALPELNLEPLVTNHIAASQGLPTSLFLPHQTSPSASPHANFSPHQTSPSGVPPSPHGTFSLHQTSPSGVLPSPNGPFSALLHKDPSPPTSSRSQQPPSLYTPPQSNPYNHGLMAGAYPQDPVSPHTTHFSNLLRSSGDLDQVPCPTTSNSGNLNSPTQFQMPTAFGAPQLEGVLANIASLVPQRTPSQQLHTPQAPQLQQVQHPQQAHWQQQVDQQASPSTTGYPTLTPSPRQHTMNTMNTMNNQSVGNALVPAGGDALNQALMETPSFDLISSVSDTLMAGRPGTNSLDAALDSMPSIGMLVSACMTTPCVTQANLSPTSSGMVWDAIIMEAATNFSRMPNGIAQVAQW